MRKRIPSYYLFAMAIIFGFLLTVQLKANITSEGIITIRKLLEMENDVNNALLEINNLKLSVHESRQKLREYEESIEDGGSIYTSMENELKKVREYAGFEKVEGPGIIITLNDSLENVEDSDNPELYLIHDIDVLEIVNDLKAAGAEAITINDVRVLGTTSIKCGGPTINIDGSRHATPFIIKAIGDPNALEATAIAPDSYIDWMEYSGIRVDIRKVKNIVINRYTGTPKINHQKIVEDGVNK